MEEFTIAARFVHFTAMLLLLGASVFRLHVGMGAARHAEEQRAAWHDFDGWLRRILLIAAVVAFVSAVAWIDSVAARMGGGWSHAANLDTLGGVLLETHFGEVWLWRLVILAALLIALGLLRPPWNSVGGALLTGLSAMLVASVALTSHASMHQGPDGTSHQVTDMIHLLCAAIWLGGLVPLGYVVRRAQRNPEWMAVLRHVLPRFSRVGYWAVAALLITGCINTGFLVSSPANLVGTLYGRVLLGKICLVLIMVVLAGINRGVLVPQIEGLVAPAGEPVAKLAASVAAELSLAMLVLAIVSVLGALPPPH